VVNVQKLESMAPEFQSMTQAMRGGGGGAAGGHALLTPTILVDKDGQPSPTKSLSAKPSGPPDSLRWVLGLSSSGLCGLMLPV
jgi:hypothetical protein